MPDISIFSLPTSTTQTIKLYLPHYVNGNKPNTRLVMLDVHFNFNVTVSNVEYGTNMNDANLCFLCNYPTHWWFHPWCLILPYEWNSKCSWNMEFVDRCIHCDILECDCWVSSISWVNNRYCVTRVMIPKVTIYGQKHWICVVSLVISSHTLGLKANAWLISLLEILPATFWWV